MATRHVELKDKFGNDICFGHGGDILCPVYVENRDWRQHLRDLKDADLKSSDVIIAGYPKTGTHWTIEIVHMLMRNTTEYDQESELPGFFDFTPQEKGSNPPDSPPRLFSTHLMLHHLPTQVWEKKVKVVYLLRNPKDVWVSLYHQTNKHRGPLGYEGTWNQFFSLMISFGYWFGDWFDYTLGWEREMEGTEVPIFTSYYEDMKKDPVGQIEKLDQFLGYNRGRQMYEAIADACSFTKLKKVKDVVTTEEVKKLFKDDAMGIFRKGEVGDWKNWFTVAENELFDEVYQRRMKDSELQFTFE